LPFQEDLGAWHAQRALDWRRQLALKLLSVQSVQYSKPKETLVMMKNSIPVWLFAVVLVLPVSGQATGTNAPQEWAGCYELSVAPADAAKQLWGKLPRYFELLTKPAYGTGTELNVKVLRSNPSRYWWLINAWQTKGENSASIIWGTGFVSYDLTLSKSGNAFAGAVHLFSDDGSTLPEFNVGVRQIACKSKQSVSH
jgi:hypothetical protein